MAEMNSALDIYKQLKKTNCRECHVPSCLAFAAAVIRGDKRLQECPHVEPTLIAEFEGTISDRFTLDQQSDDILVTLKEDIRQMDFPSSVERLGASLSGDMLTIKALGKDFSVDPDGNVHSGCHVHSWITGPLLDYVVSCKGVDVTGNWVPIRELRSGREWASFFAQRCEKPLKQVADAHTDLFELMIDIFSGKPAGKRFDSDIAVVLHPLPRLPMLICYWKPEDGMESAVNVFFDDTAEDNLSIGSIYLLGVGMVVMFDKIAESHG
jgi:Domain of unknown function (DUF3786)/Putative Fe-S cluster